MYKVFVDICYCSDMKCLSQKLGSLPFGPSLCATLEGSAVVRRQNLPGVRRSREASPWTDLTIGPSLSFSPCFLSTLEWASSCTRFHHHDLLHHGLIIKGVNGGWTSLKLWTNITPTSCVLAQWQEMNSHGSLWEKRPQDPPLPPLLSPRSTLVTIMSLKLLTSWGKD